MNGKKVRPKVVASTATIRQASDQVHGLFLRKLNIFPPTGLEIGDNFFSLQRESSEKTPGRKYIGICAPGRRLKAALIRVYVAFLSAGQVLFEKYGLDADPWMTLVGYFNSLRELGGMRRLVDDDVRTRLRKMDGSGAGEPHALHAGHGEGTDLPAGIDGHPRNSRPAGEPLRSGDPGADQEPQGGGGEYIARPLDVLLATNMISVGVDVPRLGPDGRGRSAEDDGGIHPGDQPCRS